MLLVPLFLFRAGSTAYFRLRTCRIDSSKKAFRCNAIKIGGHKSCRFTRGDISLMANVAMREHMKFNELFKFFFVFCKFVRF